MSDEIDDEVGAAVPAPAPLSEAEMKRPGVVDGRMWDGPMVELKRVGRPRTAPDGGLRDVRMPLVRVSVTEKRVFDEEAWMAKKTFSDWTRTVLMRLERRLMPCTV
jgi:hypothetical protein